MGRLTRLTKRHGKHAVQIGGETRRNDIGWLALAHYEDMEEQGRLIELPCAVGDTVYYIDKTKWIRKSTINRISIGNRLCWFTLSNGKEIGYSDKFGGITDQYFHTKEEAEAKLKELEGEKCR